MAIDAFKLNFNFIIWDHTADNLLLEVNQIF